MPFRTSAFRALTVVVCCVVAANSGALALSREQGPINPGFWPAAGQANPTMEGWPHALRISGDDRNQTALAVSLTLRGSGGFPFDSPDAYSGNARDLSEASGWWGLGLCPRSVVVVAGDSPADAVAAAALSDATGKSLEPWLRRTEAADPLFDPVGGFSRVDTDYAPLIITTSARQGGRGLSVSATLAVKDLRQGGCGTARQAIVVGGEQALDRQVDRDLLALGIDEVFRIEGADRFETAALIAASLGTAPLPKEVSGCRDLSGVDGNVESAFYANAVVEWRVSPDKCEILPRTVVLADGVMGADALAAGWWTSYWQVPVLLHDGSGALPLATAVALQTLEIQNIVVLGGTSRITELVAQEAATLSGARVKRVSGIDRYATSVAMAERLGGWWDTGRGTDFESSLVCIASSAGSARTAVGWPDALAAGAWCGAASRLETGAVTPPRALMPTGTPHSRVIPTASFRGHNMVPILLTNPREQALPLAVAAFLKRTFEPRTSWCSAYEPDYGCLYPGFAVIFGGPEVVSDAVVEEVSELVGGSIAPGSTEIPTLSNIFITESEMTPVFREIGDGSTRVCVPRGGVTNARWLLVGVNAEPRYIASVDLVSDGWFRFDNDGTTRSSGVNSPGCMRINPKNVESLWIQAVSGTGKGSEPIVFGPLASKALALDQPVNVETPAKGSGTSLGISRFTGETTNRSYTSTNVGVVLDGVAETADTATIDIRLLRGEQQNDSQTHLFGGSWRVMTQNNDTEGQLQGEALYSEGIWFLRGTSILEDSGWPGVIGGFTANIEIGSEGMSDDAISWRFDGYNRQK